MKFTFLLSLLAAFVTLSNACLTFNGLLDRTHNYLHGRIIDNGEQRCVITGMQRYSDPKNIVGLICKAGYKATLIKGHMNWTVYYTANGRSMKFPVRAKYSVDQVLLSAKHYGC